MNLMKKFPFLKQTRTLSSIVGLYFVVTVLGFSSLMILWGSYTGKMGTNRGIQAGLNQQGKVAEKLFQIHFQSLEKSLKDIVNAPKYQKTLVETDDLNLLGATLLELSGSKNLDLFLIKVTNNPKLINLSSPFFTLDPIFPSIEEMEEELVSSGKILRFRKADIDYTIMLRAVQAIEKNSGKVHGTLYGGIILNQNLAFMDSLKQQMEVSALILLYGNELIASTDRTDSEIAMSMRKNAEHLQRSGEFYRGDGLLIDFVNPTLQRPEESDYLSTGGNMQNRLIRLKRKSPLRLVMAIPDTPFVELRKSFIIKYSVSIVVTFILCIIGVLIFRKITFRSLNDLIRFSHEISTGNLSVRYTPSVIEEFNCLGQEMERMIENLKRSNEELTLENKRRKETQNELKQLNETLEQHVKERTIELERSLEALRSTQEQLIEAEKMATLGSLVSGVTHELNTPLGICITANSHFSMKTDELVQKYEEKTFSRTDLEKLFNIVKETGNIMRGNLNRAAELISSFKQVAVDQEINQTKQFNLKLYVEETLLTLKPMLKGTQHTVEFICPENLEIKSYPGAFSQIITNLIVNSLMHGFENITEGIIKIRFEAEVSRLILFYEDNGCGIEKSILDKIFIPFFTTKQGKGGTGLGMHIVRDLVSKTLNGSIQCSSDVGEGVHFKIMIPLPSLQKSDTN